jgi:hypothetical protein
MATEDVIGLKAMGGGEWSKEEEDERWPGAKGANHQFVSEVQSWKAAYPSVLLGWPL